MMRIGFFPVERFGDIDMSETSFEMSTCLKLQRILTKKIHEIQFDVKL